MEKSAIAEADVRKIVSLISATAVLDGNLAQKKRYLVEGLADLVAADRYMCNLLRVEPGKSPVALTLMHNWNDQQLAAFASWNFHRPDNPSIKTATEQAAKVGDKLWTRTTRQLGGEGWWEREHDVFPTLREAQVRDAIFSMGPVGGLPHVYSAFGLHRNQGNEQFSPREVRIAHIVLTEVRWLYSQELMPPEDGSQVMPLSPRKQTVLTLVIDGKVPKEIASTLDLSVETVRTYIRDIYRHFDVSGRAQLVRRFMTGDGGDRTST